MGSILDNIDTTLNDMNNSVHIIGKLCEHYRFGGFTEYYKIGCNYKAIYNVPFDEIILNMFKHVKWKDSYNYIQMTGDYKQLYTDFVCAGYNPETNIYHSEVYQIIEKLINAIYALDYQYLLNLGHKILFNNIGADIGNKIFNQNIVRKSDYLHVNIKYREYGYNINNIKDSYFVNMFSENYCLRFRFNKK